MIPCQWRENQWLQQWSAGRERSSGSPGTEIKHMEQSEQRSRWSIGERSAAVPSSVGRWRYAGLRNTRGTWWGTSQNQRQSGAEPDPKSRCPPHLHIHTHIKLFVFYIRVHENMFCDVINPEICFSSQTQRLKIKWICFFFFFLPFSLAIFA